MEASRREFLRKAGVSVVALGGLGLALPNVFGAPFLVPPGTAALQEPGDVITATVVETIVGTQVGTATEIHTQIVTLSKRPADENGISASLMGTQQKAEYLNLGLG